MTERIVIPAELDGVRADRVVAVLCGVSRRVARRSIEEGGVVRDDVAVGAADRLRAGDVVEVTVVEDETTVEGDDAVAFGVAFEDEDVIVVDKPPGLVVHPGAGRPSGTLANGLLARYPELGSLGEERRWGIVHRIDRDTSGLLVVARNAASFEHLQAALKRRDVKRSYLALAAGRFTNTTGTIEAPVGRDPAHPTRMAVVATGRPARTHYRRLAEWERHDLSLLSVLLDTGRTHQIRVHLRSIGHPIVGDPVYGAGGSAPGDPGRTWLHARSLTFDHPSGAGPVTVDSPLPGDLGASLETIGTPDRGAVPERRGGDEAAPRP